MSAIRHILGNEIKWSNLLAVLIELAPDTAAELLGLPVEESYQAVVKREASTRAGSGGNSRNRIDLEVAFYPAGSGTAVWAIVECKLLADFGTDQLEDYEIAYGHAVHRVVIAPFQDFLITDDQRANWDVKSWRDVLLKFSDSGVTPVKDLATEWWHYCDEVFPRATEETTWCASDVPSAAKLELLGKAIEKTEWLHRIRQGTGGSGFPVLEFYSFHLQNRPEQNIRIQLQSARRDRDPSNPAEVRICLRTFTDDPASFDLVMLKEFGESVLRGKLDWNTYGGKWNTSWERDGYFRRSFRELGIAPEWTYGYVYPDFVEFGGCYQFALDATLGEVAHVLAMMLSMMDEMAERHQKAETARISMGPDVATVENSAR